VTTKVCLLTGDSGADGTELYAEDPDSLGRYYVGPYLSYCPEFSFAIEDADGLEQFQIVHSQFRRHWILSSSP
jgi:hypothetical protein